MVTSASQARAVGQGASYTHVVVMEFCMDVISMGSGEQLVVRIAGLVALTIIGGLGYLGLNAVELSVGATDPSAWIVAPMLASMSAVLFVVGGYELRWTRP